MKVLKTEVYHPKGWRPEKRAVNVDHQGHCSVGDLLEWVVFTLAHFERAFFLNLLDDNTAARNPLAHH